MEKTGRMINETDIEAFQYYNSHEMTLNEYQRKARSTAIYAANCAILYPALGMVGEAGEVANKVKKILRDNKFDRDDIAKELGDVLWYLAILAKDLGFNLSDIAYDNLKKLEDRQKRGTLGGSGDKR